MMNLQKGFSLIEVLLSLTLTTTFSFFLLHFHGFGDSFLHQLVVQKQAMNFLDRVDERLLLGGEQKSKPVDSYIYNIEQNKEYTKVHLSWSNQTHQLTRYHYVARFDDE